MKIVEYTTVETSEVNEMIKDGWQPIGGPFVGNLAWYQAMVKYEEPNQE